MTQRPRLSISCFLVSTIVIFTLLDGELILPRVKVLFMSFNSMTHINTYFMCLYILAQRGRPQTAMPLNPSTRLPPICPAVEREFDVVSAQKDDDGMNFCKRIAYGHAIFLST